MKIYDTKDELAKAFPAALQPEAQTALAALSVNRCSSTLEPFSLRLGNELVWIPNRIYYDPPSLRAFRLTEMESELLDCIFTRHNDGLIRQAHLTRIIRSTSPWIPCFVVPLLGEYVIEIIQLIQDELPHINIPAYAEFVRSNPEFMELTESRVMSYWNCYYRSTKREEYPGFFVVKYLRSLAAAAR